MTLPDFLTTHAARLARVAAEDAERARRFAELCKHQPLEAIATPRRAKLLPPPTCWNDARPAGVVPLWQYAYVA